jgi:hypothetical protein
MIRHQFRGSLTQTAILLTAVRANHSSQLLGRESIALTAD